MVNKLLEEIKYDVSFISTHSLQPKWYKALKTLILVGFLAGYLFLFGLTATVVFFVTFLFLSFLVHMLYRTKTNRFTRSWLDFVVVEENGETRAKSIGRFYYSAIALNAIASVLVSQAVS